MQKSTTAPCKAHALSPVILLFTLPAHPPAHITPRRQRIPDQSILSMGDTHWHVQLLDKKQSALVPGTISHTTNRLHACSVSKNKSQAPVLLPRKGRRNQNPVRASILSNHAALQSMHNGVCVCMCFCQRIYLQSSCAPQESLKKATAERGR
ncbi:ribonuclease HI [Trypanosoma cruzi]|nr:ribonuclease HI [Trypanosoma cruzi]